MTHGDWGAFKKTYFQSQAAQIFFALVLAKSPACLTADGCDGPCTCFFVSGDTIQITLMEKLTRTIHLKLFFPIFPRGI